MAVAEKVISVTSILHALKALGEVRHDLVEYVFQVGCIGIFLAFDEALGKLGVCTPVNTSHVKVVFPIHQAVRVTVATASAVVTGRAECE